MKKILCITLILLISVNLFGCGKKEVQEVSKHEFEYKFKEEYSEIDGIIAATFLSVVDQLRNVHSTVLDVDNQTIDNEFNVYVEDKVAPLRDKFMASPTGYTTEEKNILKHMMQIATVSGKLQIVKLEYSTDKAHDEMGLKRKNTIEYYTEQLEDFKERIEVLLEETKDFIN